MLKTGLPIFFRTAVLTASAALVSRALEINFQINQAVGVHYTDAS